MGLRDLPKQMPFSGLGPKKQLRYILMIENHTDEELLAVLAHEVGHYKKTTSLKDLYYHCQDWINVFFFFNYV